ncbi:MAG: DUF6338 family protein [Acidobacteriia bacterium]|nr:DUF6338 family protein [Terriglobia bacterium]
MPQGLQAFAVLLILLPGFLTARIVQGLCTRPKQTDFDKLVEALTFSFFIFVLYALTFGTEMPLAWSGRTDAATMRYSVTIQRARLAVLIGYAVAFGLFTAWAVNRDVATEWLRRVGLTQRTSRKSVWSDVFHTLGRTVQVELVDGRMIRGWLRCYSDEAEDSTIFLESASWIDEDGTEYPVHGPGVLITKEAGIRAVMFLADADKLPKSDS